MKDLFDRIFNRSYIENNGCWEYAGAKDRHGYGSINIEGKMQGVHRASWAYYNGEIPKGYFILHKCDNPPCVNPDHLFLGTQADNMTDMRRKGRGQQGDKHGCAVINSVIAKQIKQLIAAGVSVTEIANKLNVRPQIVGQIKNGYSWRHI